MMLIDDVQYNKFKDVFTRDKAADAGRSSGRNLNIEATKDQVFSKFDNAQTVDDFEQILEDDFENQYDYIIENFGEGAPKQKYPDFDKTLGELWQRLQKLMAEGGRKKPKESARKQIIQSFISNYQNKEVQDDFFGMIEGIIEKTSLENRSSVINEVRKEFTSEQKAKILDILSKNFSQGSPPSLDNFYSNDIPYFNYFALEYYLHDTKIQPTTAVGWTRMGENVKLKGDNRNLVKYSKLFKVESKTKEDEDKLLKKLAKKETSIAGVIRNYSLPYEIFKQRDEKLKGQKLKDIKFQQQGFVVKQMNDTEKIKTYFSLMSKRTGVSPLDMAILVNDKKTIKLAQGGAFFRRDGKYAEAYPILEDLILDGLSKALEKVGRTSLINDEILTNYLQRKANERKQGTITTDALRAEQVKLHNSLSAEGGKGMKGMYFDGEMLKELLEIARTNETIQQGKKSKQKTAASLGKYIKDGEIQLDDKIEQGIFGQTTTQMMDKLVRVGKDEDTRYFTFSKKLQLTMATALQELAKIAGKQVILNQETQIVSYPDNKGTEVSFTRASVGDKTFAEFEEKIKITFSNNIERIIFDYIITTGEEIISEEEIKNEEGEVVETKKTKNFLFRENPSPSRKDGKRIFTEDFQNYTMNITKKEALAFTVWVAKNYLDKDYTELIDKIQDAREDLSLENNDLVNSIGAFSSTLENDLKELKNLVVQGIDEKLNQVANRSGKFSKILKTKNGQKLERHLVTMGFLESEESG